MSNPLSDLNAHLFSQLTRLSDENLKGEHLEEEINRARAVSTIAKDITSNASLALRAYQIQSDVIGTRAQLPDFLGLSHEGKAKSP